jgi:hypothetical protein
MEKSIFTLSLLILLSLQIKAQSVQAPEVKNRVFKVQFFSPLYGTLNFDYEQYIKNNINLDAGFGIIGIGFNELAEVSSGFYIKAGPRLYFSPDFYTDDMKRYSDFQGWYFRPEMLFSYFKFEEWLDPFAINTSNEKLTNASMGILLNIGRQWAIANVVSLELSYGLGYNINFNDESDLMPLKYAYIGGSGGVPIATSFKFAVGVLNK